MHFGSILSKNGRFWVSSLRIFGGTGHFVPLELELWGTCAPLPPDIRPFCLPKRRLNDEKIDWKRLVLIGITTNMDTPCSHFYYKLYFHTRVGLREFPHRIKRSEDKLWKLLIWQRKSSKFFINHSLVGKKLMFFF